MMTQRQSVVESNMKCLVVTTRSVVEILTTKSKNSFWLDLAGNAAAAAAVAAAAAGKQIVVIAENKKRKKSARNYCREIFGIYRWYM